MSRNLLTADQVAARLGVKLSTVYAYVSRGVLHRTVAERRPHQPLRRGRGRAAGPPGPAPHRRPPGWAPSTWCWPPRSPASSTTGSSTGVTTAVDLARTSTFEAVAELLWSGVAARVGRRGADLAGSGRRARPAPPHAERCPSASPVTERLAVVTAALACANPLRIDLQPDAVQPPCGLADRHAWWRCCPPMAGPLGVRRPGSGREPRPDGARRRRPVAERLWPRLSRRAGHRQAGAGARRRPDPAGRPRAGDLDAWPPASRRRPGPTPTPWCCRGWGRSAACCTAPPVTPRSRC